MNWVFDTYSNLYAAAMLQEQNHERHAASAKKRASGERLLVLRLFGRH
jgi:hypothetical protein